jgi:transposase
VVAKLGIGTWETLRKRVREEEIDSGKRPGTTTEESAQIKAPNKENAELKRAKEILQAAKGFFAAELNRPHLWS